MIERWSCGDADRFMPESILLELDEQVSKHPWWNARARLSRKLLELGGIAAGSTVLDAGTGWGVTLRHLETTGYTLIGLDVAAGALERLDNQQRRLIHADLSRPFPADSDELKCDAVLALDVIEHLDDDQAALRELGRTLRPGGLMIVSVPALPGLFGEFDRVQGHRLRYLPDRLITAFGSSGLQLERWFWWGQWMVPLMRIRSNRQIGRVGESAEEVYARYLALPSWIARKGLEAMFALEEPWALQGRLCTGTSLFAIARRSGAPGKLSALTSDRAAL